VIKEFGAREQILDVLGSSDTERMMGQGEPLHPDELEVTKDAHQAIRFRPLRVPLLALRRPRALFWLPGGTL
jgi:hypothetical protein